MSDEQFVYLGNIPNEVSRKSSIVREDRRTVTIRQQGLTLSSIGDASTLRLVDQKGKGILRSIKVVTDNPYVELLLEIDDWRNEGQTPAELLYGGTGKQDYGLYAMDGGNPAKGYTMMYTPQGGEAFDGRLRIFLRNRIPKSKKVYGNQTSLQLGGSLPAPVNLGHTGGDSFSAPSFKDEPLTRMAEAMATPHFGQAYQSNRFNTLALGASVRVGIDHPYVGLAGKPIFSTAHGEFTGATAEARNVIFFGPRTPSGDSFEQIMYITNQANDQVTGFTHDFQVGQRLFVRDGGTIHFPGEITALQGTQPNAYPLNNSYTLSDALPQAEFGEFRGNEDTGGAQQNAFQVTLKPGLEVTPGPITTTLSDGNTTMDGVGQITTQAETDPIIGIKSIEIKYQLEVSYDG